MTKGDKVIFNGKTKGVIIGKMEIKSPDFPDGYAYFIKTDEGEFWTNSRALEKTDEDFYEQLRLL